jgi:omega-3 fatty acid desaturase (delta-15 desaturase)
MFPFYGWHIYLYGMPDGSHYFPYAAQRMWKESTPQDRTNCLISFVVVLLGLGLQFAIHSHGGEAWGGKVASFFYYFVMPYVVFGWWLVTVTYLQHHNPDTVVYDDSEWKFVDAAFETVDRTFGFGLDTLHHHITDGHVVHHLFFTKIPHYNLPIATKALKQYMEENGLGRMYKAEKTYDFAYKVHSSLFQFGFKAHRSSEFKAKAEVLVEGKKEK